MKKFIGYYILGAQNQDDAQNEKGLLLWSTQKPSGFKRFMNRLLLNIYWVDKERYSTEKENRNPDVQLHKVRWSKQPQEKIK
jgi:hypothetical protein